MSLDYLHYVHEAVNCILVFQAAVGILTYAQQNLGVQLKESW